MSKSLLKEFKTLMKTPLDGIVVTVNEENLSELLADISGPVGTPYDGG